MKGKSTKIVMVAFDLLYLNGYDLRKLSLTKRKAHLKKLIANTDVQFTLRLTAKKCIATPARSSLRASCPRSLVAAMPPAGPTIGSRRPAPSARH